MYHKRHHSSAPQRDQIHTKAESSGRHSHWSNKIKKFSKNISKAIIQSHSQYVNEMVDLKTNPKMFWSYIKTCVPENIGIPSFYNDLKEAYIEIDNANFLRKYFHSPSPRKPLLPPINAKHCVGRKCHH